MLNTGDSLYASEMNTFKSRIQAEMADYGSGGSRGRRGMGLSPYGHGSMAGLKPLNGTNVGYGDFRGAFSVAPTSNDKPIPSQYAETVGYISPYFKNTAGANVGWAYTVNSGTTLGQVWDIYNLLVNVLALDSVTTSNPHCQGYCTGLCSNSCSGACENGCTAAHGNCSNVNTTSYPNNR